MSNKRDTRRALTRLFADRDAAVTAYALAFLDREKLRRRLASMDGELRDLKRKAREVGARLGALAQENASCGTPRAFILGGETVVRLTGNGKGGRNQELALAAAAEIAGTENIVVFSVGSDGTDGPTDAAGGLADGGTVERLAAAGKTVADVLQNNDAYHALRDTGDLIITGPTGTNVNDFAAALVR